MTHVCVCGLSADAEEAATRPRRSNSATADLGAAFQGPANKPSNQAVTTQPLLLRPTVKLLQPGGEQQGAPPPALVVLPLSLSANGNWEAEEGAGVAAETGNKSSTSVEQLKGVGHPQIRRGCGGLFCSVGLPIRAPKRTERVPKLQDSILEVCEHTAAPRYTSRAGKDSGKTAAQDENHLKTCSEGATQAIFILL